MNKFALLVAVEKNRSSLPVHILTATFAGGSDGGRKSILFTSLTV